MKKAIACLLVLPLTLASGRKPSSLANHCPGDNHRSDHRERGKAPRRKPTSRASRAGCGHAVPEVETAQVFVYPAELFQRSCK